MCSHTALFKGSRLLRDELALPLTPLLEQGETDPSAARKLEGWARSGEEDFTVFNVFCS